MSGTGDVHFDFALDEWRAGRGPNPRPRRRIKASDAGRAKCLSEHARCRLCGSGVSLQRHHVVPRSQGGDDVDANLVPLCPECHRLVTENDRSALARLRWALHPDEAAYAVERKGAAWLDRRYPLD